MSDHQTNNMLAKQQHIYLISLLFMCIIFMCSGQNEGESCRNERYNIAGVCKTILQCTKVYNDLRNQRIRPQQCGYRGDLPIVCCPNDKTLAETVQRLTVPARNPNFGRKSREKCKEYGELVYTIQYPVGFVDSEESTTTKINECAVTKANLIYGGEPAKPKEFPHMALLGYQLDNRDYVYGCGGSIVSDKFILTAAHCIDTRDYGSVVHVRLGDLNVSSTGDDGLLQKINVKKTTKHPNYRSNRQYDDIALIELETAIEFNSYIRPICLNTKEVRPESSAIATGWGATEYVQQSDALQKVQLPYINATRCKELYTRNKKLVSGINAETQLCAGYEDQTKDTCHGDSGGPLQVYSEVYCLYDQVGVTSFGKECGFLPGVYTKVLYYVDWIEGIVWP